MTEAELIERIDGRQEFVTGDDGFVIFWPEEVRQGGFTSHVLRTIADELDRRNADWQKIVDEGLTHD